MENNTQKLQTDNKTIYESVSFTRNVLWVGLAQVFTQFLGIITLPALTKTYSSEIFGIWSQISVTVGLISPLLTLHFGTAVVRFLSGEEDKLKRRRYLGSMLFAICIFSCFAFLVSVLWPNQFSQLMFDSINYVDFVIPTFLWTIISALFSFLISYMRARNQIGSLSIIQGVIAAAKMVIIVIVARMGLNLKWILISMIGTELMIVFIMMWNITRDIGFPYPNFSGIKQFLIFSLPQIPTGVLGWIISASDRYFITQFLNLSQTGIYSSSRMLGGLIALFLSPISFVLLPVVSRALEQKQLKEVKNYFEYSTKLFLTLAIPAASGLTMLSQPLLEILTTSEYLVGWELVLLVAIGTIFSGIYQINMYIIYLVNQTKWLPFMVVIASVTSVATNYWLIPKIGIIGASISNIVSYFVLAAIVSIWTKKLLNFIIDLKYMSKVIIAAAIMVICLYFVKIDGIIGIVLSIIGGVIIFGATLILLRAFSEQEKQLIKHILFGLISKKNRN